MTTIRTQAATHQDNQMVDLSHFGLIRVSGEDAAAFLQGQVTNDVNAITDSASQYTGYCTPKGRLLALFFAFKHKEQLYLSLDAGITPSIIKRLRMYVLRAKVILEEAHSDIARFGVSGPSAKQHLLKHFPNLPETDFGTVNHDGITIIKLAYTQPAYQLVMLKDQKDKINNLLNNDFKLVDMNQWNYLETVSGIPEVVTSTQEAFVPQMVNLDTLGGINFKKGCYTGQEIVARTHYLGKVKRRTYLGEVTMVNEECPNAGDTIWDITQQNVGQVVRVAKQTNDTFVILFECRVDSIQQTLNWKNVPIKLLSLPYVVEE